MSNPRAVVIMGSTFDVTLRLTATGVVVSQPGVEELDDVIVMDRVMTNRFLVALDLMLTESEH